MLFKKIWYLKVKFYQKNDSSQIHQTDGILELFHVCKQNNNIFILLTMVNEINILTCTNTLRSTNFEN